MLSKIVFTTNWEDTPDLKTGIYGYMQTLGKDKAVTRYGLCKEVGHLPLDPKTYDASSFWKNKEYTKTYWLITDALAELVKEGKVEVKQRGKLNLYRLKPKA